MQENTKSMAVRTPCCSKIGLNRGPWSPEEDILLSHYIQAFGEGRWRTLPKKAGLRRCGKSCRLRWMNYLRPDVKRGYISPEEEDLILRLHRLLGNRWSLIAGRIPGRTDNEIKNYWNTHLSKQLISQGIDPRTHKPLPESRIETSANCNTGTPENSDMTPKPSGQESQPLQPDQTEVITNKTLKKCPESVGTGLNKDQYTTNNHIGSNDVHLPRKKHKPDNAVDLFRTCTLTQPPHVIASSEAINYYEGMADMIQWKSRSKASQAMGSSRDHMTPFMFHDLFPSTIPLPFIESEKGVSILQVSSSTSVLNNLSININNESCDPGLLGHNRSPYWMNNHVMNFDMPLNAITVSGGSQVADLYGDYNGQIGHSATPPTSKSEYNVLYEGNQLSSPSLGVGNFDLSKVHRRHHHVIQKEENFMLPAEENAMVANQANNSSNIHHMGPMVANQANNSSNIHHMGPMVANQANNSSNVHHIVQIPPDGNSDLYSSYFVDSIAHEDLLNINNTNNNPASSFATSTSQALQLRLEPETPNLSYDLWSLPQYHPYV